MDTQTTTPHSPADRAQAVGQDSKQAAQAVASTAGEEAKRTTREAKDQARQLWSQTRSDLTEQASAQQTRAASSLRQLAEQLQSMAGAADQEGPARGLVEDVARRAGDAATWLDQRDPGSLLDEARDFARRRPGTFLAVAAGIGVIAGRLSRSLVDEARDSDASTSGGAYGTTAGGAYGTTTGGAYGTTTGDYGTTGGYGTGSLGATGSDLGTGVPTATSPTTSTTASTPVTPGATPSAVSEGASSVPSAELPGPHRTSQPMAPDGTPSPIDREGRLTAEGDAVRGER